ncbi:uncharacterized protein BT62DRAFT_52041 [Guyanagaster necrorhizus]|uniref:Uncharacterized protein n=1 Tax=Guyanagaster necrorhizus TaxID=856835 RepID=A0A9P7W6V2_9AGAR|nr:uncharacterized protein BT62DRAFT_52041 [Guyanagaster necrorhizus MCA 3950]KAG7453218.1 hypothetical protein BT62DRAFT_52041 [Guyanagaster necrorhizus MCA 3950]
MARMDYTSVVYDQQPSSDDLTSASFDSHSTCSNLFGISCTNNPSSLDGTGKVGHICDDDGLQGEVLAAYPSPPSSSSPLGRSVPLPTLCVAYILPRGATYGGILDSPVLVDHDLGMSFLPLSPPPTLPTPTTALPPTDEPAAPPLPFAPPLDLSLPFPLISDDSLLSPLSPEWESSKITDIRSSPTHTEPSVLLAEHHPEDNTTSPLSPLSPLDVDDSQPGLSHYYEPSPQQLDSIDSDVDWWLQSPTMRTHTLPPDELESPPDDSFYSLIYDFVPDDAPHVPHPSPTIQPLDLPDDPYDPPIQPFSLLAPPNENSLQPEPSDRHSLLLIDYANDVPQPRSPSPENFDLNPLVVNGCSDPDLQKLIELRKRSQAAERVARQLEYTMLDRGDMLARAEAKRERKREKERTREISALLRLKLGDEIVMSPRSEESSPLRSMQPMKKKSRSPKKVIASMAHLVARMVFRRHDTVLPLSKSAQDQARPSGSPLRKSWAVRLDSEDEDEEEDMLSLGLGGFDDGSDGLWTIPKTGGCWRGD